MQKKTQRRTLSSNLFFVYTNGSNCELSRISDLFILVTQKSQKSAVLAARGHLKKLIRARGTRKVQVGSP